MADIRPIDANALAEELRRESLDVGFYRAIYEGAARKAEAAPTIDYVPRQQWISVKDRLPTDKRFVLVYVKHPVSHSFPAWSCIMTDMYLGDRWAENADEEVHEVTHWMPLPEPPKEE